MSANLTVATFSLGELTLFNMADGDRHAWACIVLPWMVGLVFDYSLFQYDRNDSTCLYGYLRAENGTPSHDYSAVCISCGRH